MEYKQSLYTSKFPCTPNKFSDRRVTIVLLFHGLIKRTTLVNRCTSMYPNGSTLQTIEDGMSISTQLDDVLDNKKHSVHTFTIFIITSYFLDFLSRFFIYAMLNWIQHTHIMTIYDSHVHTTTIIYQTSELHLCSHFPQMRSLLFLISNTKLS